MPEKNSCHFPWLLRRINLLEGVIDHQNDFYKMSQNGQYHHLGADFHWGKPEFCVPVGNNNHLLKMTTPVYMWLNSDVTVHSKNKNVVRQSLRTVCGGKLTCEQLSSVVKQNPPLGPERVPSSITCLHTQKAYTHTGTSSPQILMLSAHAYMHFAWEFGKMNICMSRFGVRIGWRKYLYECTPFGYLNLWFKVSKSPKIDPPFLSRGAF